VKLLGTLLALQVVLGLVLVALVATDNLPFGDDEADGASGEIARPKVDRFDSAAAWKLLVEQVELGPRPAGSATSRTLARRLRRLLPNGRFEAVPGGLRNIVGTVPGRAGLRRAGRALRHQGHSRVPGGQRRRVGHRGGD
jgi:hypothetical protein